MRNGRSLVFDLFDVPWAELDRSAVEAFLEGAGEEGVTWEAKGSGERQGRPRPESLRKAACGFANQIGGYLIIGASREGGSWALSGIQAPDEEPGLWIGQILRRLQPAPRFEVSETFDVGQGKIALVVRVEPVSTPPCMTPHGRIYERVSGETRPVEDPALLDRLLRRGEHARERAEQFARRAAERAISLPLWRTDWSASIAVGLASVGRETEDISSRLFSGATHDAMVKSIWELLGDIQPEQIDVGQRQDCCKAVADSPSNTHFDVDGETVVGIIRTSRFLQANWDGSVAAGAWFSDDLLQDAVHPEQVIAKCWREAAAIGQRLGGYGPSYIHVLTMVARSEGSGRPPPKGTLYSRLPRRTDMGRLLDTPDPDEETISSLRREVQRAAGIRTDEPE